MTNLDTTEGTVAGPRLMVRALRHRNYRLFFGGHGLSMVGSWMQWTAMGWLVYRLTGSKAMLGTVAFATQIPAFLLASLAGVVADRVNRRHLVLVTQSLATVQALALAYLTLAGLVEVWHIIALSVGAGLVNAFDIPARQSLVVDMLDNRADLPNAIALNSFLFNGARLVGPWVAGILIHLVGEGVCFLVNAASFLAIIAALLAMRIPRPRRVPSGRHVLSELRDGFAYVLGHKTIRGVLAMIAIVSLFGMPYGVLMPVFAKDILGGDAYTFGILAAAPGVGALVGALFLASRRNVLGLGRLMRIAGVLFGCGLIGFSLSRNLWLSLVILAPLGFGLLIMLASGNTLVQSLVDDDKRGRVMSLWMMSFMGMAPFGSLMAGFLAERIGAPTTVLIGGAACIVATLVFGRRLPRAPLAAPPTAPANGTAPDSDGPQPDAKSAG